ncbi:MAG TPA: hypothetical protein PLO67_02450 [Saprospiraceae bacterium]|nr:hypothetical protein [Saprospiraceae bacterium]
MTAFRHPFSPVLILGFARSIWSRIMGIQTRKIRYSSDGRYGHVHYESPETSFALYYEFGGGNVVACIDIPGPEDWQKHTGLPVAQRDEVLHFIGEQVVHDQARGGSFKIEGNWMNIYV